MLQMVKQLRQLCLKLLGLQNKMMITLHPNYYFRRNCEGVRDLKLPAVSGSDVKKKGLKSNFRAHKVKARIGLLNQG